MGQEISLTSERNTHDLNHELTFSAHTYNCVCHSIRSMFRVLGVYNFDPVILSKKAVIFLSHIFWLIGGVSTYYTHMYIPSMYGARYKLEK